MPPLIHKAGALATCLLGLLTLAGCDQQRIDELQVNVSTEADVRARLGEPARVWPEAGGANTLEYNRQPSGHVNYMVTIGPSGTLTALQQVLVPENFARVQPGMEQQAVRRLLGLPARQVTYDLSRETDWDWNWLDGPTRAMVFTATFGPDGRVRRSGSREYVPPSQ
ncbi:MAG: outer membrane protein assembly factor BamE [Comamonadaceae bacterium]|nr:outer membrane protein assembly factor BamE [Burkholderiales bacterium]MEB2348379.1 outer membrane protein assembly factor BamE [Comamonadaceae bacterium]